MELGGVGEKAVFTCLLPPTGGGGSCLGVLVHSDIANLIRDCRQLPIIESHLLLCACVSACCACAVSVLCVVFVLVLACFCCVVCMCLDAHAVCVCVCVLCVLVRGLCRTRG